MLDTNVNNFKEEINPMFTQMQKPKEMILEKKSKITQ